MNDGFLKSLLEKLPGSWQIDQGKALAFGHTPAADLPECNASRENEHRYIRGAAGVADREVVCEKDAANAWAWQDRAKAALGALYQPLDSDLTVIAGLADPNADRILFWDDSAGAYAHLDPYDPDITISGTMMALGTAPTIADFTNAQHDHGDADDGGLIPSASVTGLGMVLINETAHSAATTNSVNNCFSATYENYMIEVNNMTTTGAVALLFRLRVGGADGSGAGTYHYASKTVNSSPAEGIGGSSSTTYISPSHGAATMINGAMTIYVRRPFLALPTLFNSLMYTHHSGSGVGQMYVTGGEQGGNTSFDGFTFLLNGAGNVSCTTRVYGLRNTP